MVSVSFDPRFPVAVQDRLECIDVVNRLNLAFDEWDVETMVAIFTEDGVVTHPTRNVQGHAELRGFYENYYPITLGVRRQAVNHVVDGLEGGLVRVTSYNLLIRVATRDNDRPVKDDLITYDRGGFPALSMHSLMIDTLRKDDGFGWRISERRTERTVVNDALR